MPGLVGLDFAPAAAFRQRSLKIKEPPGCQFGAMVCSAGFALRLGHMRTDFPPLHCR